MLGSTSAEAAGASDVESLPPARQEQTDARIDAGGVGEQENAELQALFTAAGAISKQAPSRILACSNMYSPAWNSLHGPCSSLAYDPRARDACGAQREHPR